MRQISPKAVIVGSLFDIIGTQLLLLVLITAICAPMLAGGGGHVDAAQIRVALENSGLFKVGGWLIGALMSILAGYIAAAIAKRGELLNGALSAVLCFAFGLYALLSGAAAHSPWTAPLELVLSPLLGVFGGYLRARGRTPA
jgi:hypothetical protein